MTVIDSLPPWFAEAVVKASQRSIEVVSLHSDTRREDTACVHLGRHLRDEMSRLCGGCGRISVIHVCNVLGECTPFGKTDERLQWCLVCQRRT